MAFKYKGESYGSNQSIGSEVSVKKFAMSMMVVFVLGTLAIPMAAGNDKGRTKEEEKEKAVHKIRESIRCRMQ